MFEEAADSDEVLIAFHDGFVLLVRELVPWHIHRNLFIACPSPQLSEDGPVLRLRPWFDSSFSQCFRLIGDHQVHVEINGVAETLAPRAGAEGIIEREQPRLRLLVPYLAAAAFKPTREAELFRFFALARNCLEDCFSRLPI